ncbi:fluoride efflux transporter FluC [Secundilactobacillus kimchicus]|uniref:Fluoride-specific ion channel FluC n=1 Tax=Secundilactobacillus kimchicus JCM 15530 TaxID=1302272 RepID=A0A0R1HNG5_9LACO|nr:CrcB family protein [Secundilactobacillus kimchicus]KRK47883.1 hypothetical protein FC96_GL002088 [Secundilactobacillus kimchicus JCM 15530]MBT9671514.1 chromosome condensation protein CrcB [Secundilactobacillus kimchicus]
MKKIIAIAGFGFLGALLRLTLTQLAGSHHALMTILINVAGSLLLAVVTGLLPLWLPVSDTILTGLSVGFVGTFTTFSTFCVDTVTLQQPWGAVYWLISLALGYGAAWTGVTLTDRAIARRKTQW